MLQTTEKPVRDRDLFSAASDAESDMFAVYDYALLIFDALSDKGELDEDRKGALCRLSGELVSVGDRLRDHNRHFYTLARERRAVAS